MNSFRDLKCNDQNGQPLREGDIILDNNSLYILKELSNSYITGQCVSYPITDSCLNNFRNKQGYRHLHRGNVFRRVIKVPENIIDHLAPGSRALYNEIIKYI